MPFFCGSAIILRMEEAIIGKCTACPVRCGAIRAERAGYCGANRVALSSALRAEPRDFCNKQKSFCGVQGLKIAKYYLHPFEEPCISFKNGSGTIFFTGCNLKCVFCQNYELSRAARGIEITPARLADIFRELEDTGADNISLVTPSHLIFELEKAFKLYRPKIPVVYNSGGYDSVESLKRIDEYISIYLPDMKWKSEYLSARYTGRRDYFSVASQAIKFMADKPLLFEEPAGGYVREDGVKKMLSGLIVRHMVMPMGVTDTLAILKWFKNELPDTAYLSLMSQYTPFGEINDFPELKRGVTAREYNEAVNAAFALGISNVFVQKRSSSGEKYIPKWDY